MVLPGSKKQKNRRRPERPLRKQWEKAAAWGLQGIRKDDGRRKTRTAGEMAAKSKTQTAKAEPVVKMVEVEKEKFLNISEIEPNVSQPRKMFDEEQLGELAESIRRYGVLQPLLVQKKGDRYELIAGGAGESCQTGRISGSSGDRARVYETADDGDRPDRECTACRFKIRLRRAKAYQMLIQGVWAASGGRGRARSEEPCDDHEQHASFETG